MIQEVITPRCPPCRSREIVKNGHTPKGKPQYRCKACGRSGVLPPSVPYTGAQREQILAAYSERPSMREMERVFGVARQTVAVWLKKSGAGSHSQGHAAARASAR
jgi:insertion element IS1 protein InsB